MKLRNLDKTWDFMPENAFDNKSATEAYEDMYNYGRQLEDEVKRLRVQTEMYKNEIRALNAANTRKAYRIQSVNLFRKCFPR
jgi:hypothetical protein